MINRNNLTTRERKELLRLAQLMKSCPPESSTKAIKSRHTERVNRYHHLMDKLFETERH